MNRRESGPRTCPPIWSQIHSFQGAIEEDCQGKKKHCINNQTSNSGAFAMLVHLSIHNYAIVDYLDLELDAGMSAISGETGAGGRN